MMAKSETINNNRKRKFKEARGAPRRKLAGDVHVAERAALLSQFVPKILPSAGDLVLGDENAS